MGPDPSSRFESQRRRLLGVAYRMLGTRTDAEDVVQDAWLRWREADHDALRDEEAWLVTVTTRLSIDRLRAAKVLRASYTGMWLPEPFVAPLRDHPEALAEQASDVSTALLVALERLAPEERAAYLLREVFDRDYPEIADILGKTETACRQLAHRAKERVQREQPRFVVTPAAHLEQVRRFVAAATSGRPDAIRAMVAPDVALTSDGGGRVPSIPRVLVGADRVARLYEVVARRFGDGLRHELADVDGTPGVLRFFGERLESVQSFVTSDAGIHAIFMVRNPDKLRLVAWVPARA